MRHQIPFYYFLIIGFLYACSTDPAVNSHLPTLPIEHYNYEGSQNEIPSSINGDNTPSNNQITNEAATLGRVLFYDPVLSLNNAVSCATCHQQHLSFSDGLSTSLGFNGKSTTRNSPTILNMRFSERFFWDMSQSDLESQVVVPIGNHIEMGMEDFDYLVEKLAQTEYYPQLFKESFGTSEITEERISKSLSQFLRSINSFESRFDKGRDIDFENFTPLELAGKSVFVNANCNSCHRVLGESSQLMNGQIIFFDQENGEYSGGSSASDFANIGLNLETIDPGINNGQFKIPNLRNLVYSAPYMHDGRFKNLDEVIEHYNSGVQSHPFLHPNLRDSNGDPLKLNLTQFDKEALKAFLFTLTDESIVTDVKLSDPFKK
jgi:cytochrome c peroxidase